MQSPMMRTINETRKPTLKQRLLTSAGFMLCSAAGTGLLYWSFVIATNPTPYY